MITSENSSVARESSSVIILKSRLDSTGHSASTSEVRDIFDRLTHVPNDWWQLMCSRVLQPWDRLNSMTAPICNITFVYKSYLSYIKKGLALNNVQGLICHKIEPINQSSLMDY